MRWNYSDFNQYRICVCMREANICISMLSSQYNITYIYNKMMKIDIFSFKMYFQFVLTIALSRHILVFD